MATKKTLSFNLVDIITAYKLNDAASCEELEASYELDAFEERILRDLFADIEVSGEYMNEEELKIRIVGLLFYAAKIDVPSKIRVFYERPLSALVGEYNLNVIVDCMVASTIRSSPIAPYFFPSRV